jgi:hypothetical protein
VSGGNRGGATYRGEDELLSIREDDWRLRMSVAYPPEKECSPTNRFQTPLFDSPQEAFPTRGHFVVWDSGIETVPVSLFQHGVVDCCSAIHCRSKRGRRASWGHWKCSPAHFESWKQRSQRAALLRWWDTRQLPYLMGTWQRVPAHEYSHQSRDAGLSLLRTSIRNSAARRAPQNERNDCRQARHSRLDRCS